MKLMKDKIRNAKWRSEVKMEIKKFIIKNNVMKKLYNKF